MPYYGPEEPVSEILLERNFLAGDFICGVGYGIQLVLYISCARYLWSQRKTRRKSLFLLGYITLLIIIQTIFAAVQARTVQVIYIDNRNYPGGPWAYFLATQALAINVMFYSTIFVLTFLSDMLVLWRCWVIWAASEKFHAYLVTFPPALLLLASFVMGTLWTLQSSQPGLSLYSSLPIAYGTSYYALSLSVNIILTVLIMIRLYLYRRRILSHLSGDHGRHYISLATILVESAAIYSVVAILFLITYAVNNPTNQVWLGIASSTQQIAGYLIISRVAEGRAWKKDTLTQQPTLPTINSDDSQKSRSEQTTTDDNNFETSTVDTLRP